MGNDVEYGGFLDAVVKSAPLDGNYTRRQFMVRKLVQRGETVMDATTAVAYVEANHRGWDWDTEHTWDEWEAALTGGSGE